MNDTHRIFSASIEGGIVIAASVDSPRFCVGAPTAEEATAKAARALTYYNSVRKTLRTTARETRVVSPSFRIEELCA